MPTTMVLMRLGRCTAAGPFTKEHFGKRVDRGAYLRKRPDFLGWRLVFRAVGCTRVYVVGHSKGQRSFSVDGVGGTVNGTFRTSKVSGRSGLVTRVAVQIVDGFMSPAVDIRRVRSLMRGRLVGMHPRITGGCVVCHR